MYSDYTEWISRLLLIKQSRKCLGYIPVADQRHSQPIEISSRFPLLLCLTVAATFARLKIRKGFVKLSRLLLLSLTATLAFAQQSQDENSNSVQWSPATLAGEFLEHDFVNWFAFADGVYDTYAPFSRPNGQVGNDGSFGWDIGGGVNLRHGFRDGRLSISYRGSYRDYQNATYSTGTDQNLSIGYSKRLARQWSLSTNLGAGISFYGGTFFASPSNTGDVITSNPFAGETRYLSAGASLTYQQSRRLSYVVSGGYFLQRYNYAGAVGNTGFSGSGSVLYRTTARTTIGGTYSHSYFTFQRNVGTANGNTAQLSVSHQFPNHWNASVAGGVTFSSVSGISVYPVNNVLVNGVLLNGYLVGPYKESTSFPSFSGSVSRAFRKSNFSVSAGQGLSPGNGYYLASKSLYLGGVYSRSLYQRQNIGFAGGYSHLSSVANSVSSTFSSGSFTTFYSVNLVRYFGVNAAYNFVHYGALTGFGGVNDNRLSFGVNFSSKSIPLTLF